MIKQAILAITLLAAAALEAAKAPARITRDGLFKAVEIGGLAESDLIALIQEYGVDFECAAEDERRLVAAKLGPKVLAALRAHYRVAPLVAANPSSSPDRPRTGGAVQEQEQTGAEPDEIVAGAPAPSAAPAQVGAAIEVEETEVVAGGAPPAASAGPAVVEEETVIVAGGAKPPSAVAPPPAEAAMGEFTAAVAQRKVFPSVPASLVPFLKGTRVVKVQVRIDERGSVQQAKVLGMTGEKNETAARLAVQSANQWQFVPARQGGKAVPSEQVLRFVL